MYSLLSTFKMLGLHSSHAFILPFFLIFSVDAVHTLQMHTVCSPWQRPERGPGEHRAAQHLFVKAAWRIIMAYTPLGSPPPPLFSNGRSLM